MSIICFAFTYAITLVLEMSRLLWRVAVYGGAVIFFAAAGLFAHSLYLVFRFQQGMQQGVPLSSWYEWCMLAAWILAAAYLWLLLRRPHSALGLFFLPVVLGLVAVAYGLRGRPHFTRNEATLYWGALHGVLLLLGTVAVLLGFIAGTMYLVQSYRLKRKLLPRRGLYLPSLEWLQQANTRALIASTLLLVGGLLAGIVLNIARHTQATIAVPWGDPIVWSSAVLVGWLLVVMAFNALYRPAQQGRKVAYLTVANFVFLVMALTIAFWGRHASGA